MANSVVETSESWKSDAATNDTNLPIASSNAATGQSQELAGNIRLLKSQIKFLAERTSWSRWKGERNAANTANIAFTFVNASTFTINDDFVTALPVAMIGRRVAVFLSGAVPRGTIIAASYSAPNTTVTIQLESGFTLDSTLTDVWFGPEPGATAKPPATISQLTNVSGSGAGAGSVMVIDSTGADRATFTTVLASRKSFVVPLHAVLNGAKGEFITSGYVSNLLVTGAVTIGRYLGHSGSTGRARDTGISATDTDEPPAGAFGIALSSVAGPGDGTVEAHLFGSTYGATIGSGKWQLNSGVADGIYGIFTHSNTVSRTYSFPNADIVVVGLDNVQTLSNKTLASPGLSAPVLNSAAPGTPVANTVYKESVVQGRVLTSGGGSWTIDADLNVGSITDRGTGLFTINWATPFADVNYGVIGVVIMNPGSNPLFCVEDRDITKTVSSVGMKCVGVTNIVSDPDIGVFVMAAGAQ